MTQRTLGRRALGVGGIAGATVMLARHGRAAAKKPVYGGRLRFAYELAPGALDPAVGRSGGDTYYWRPLCDQLVDVDPQMRPRPARSLAESWDVSDPTSVTFRLRKGVVFHDGTPFDADAVKFNMDRLLDPATKATARANFSRLVGVEVVDSHSVRFRLKQPWGPMFVNLADRGGAMNSPTAVKALGVDYAFKPVSTGPFKLAEYVSGSHVRYVRNERYWGRDDDGNPLPYLDELVIHSIPQQTVQVASLRAGELDVIWLPLREVPAIQADSRFTVQPFEGSGVSCLIAYNMAKAPMDNVHLRRAVAYAINGEALNRAVYSGRAITAKSGMWPPNTPAYDPTVPRPTYNPAKARAELGLAGFASGVTVDLAWWPGEYNSPAGELIRAQLAAVGIKVNVKNYEVTTVTEKFFYGGDAHIYMTPWSRNPDPDTICGMMYRSDGYYNAGKVKDPAMDALIDQAAALVDMNQRLPIYRRIDEIVLDEARVTPLVYGVTYAAASKRVGGTEGLFDFAARAALHRIWVEKS